MPLSTAVPIIDLHAHIHGFGLPVGHHGAEDLLREMDRHQIEVTAVSSALAIMYDMVEGNAALARDIATSDRLRGYVFPFQRF